MKEQVTKFNLRDAFKALDEIETPKVGGVRPNKDNHKELAESMRPTPKTDCLLEDYYNVNSPEELETAAEDRQEDVAQAKLDKIQKIVDLDAKTPEDIQPSYVGKTIIQCPQCMSLFYKNPKDIHVSDDDPTIVNVGETCPNCNNDAGYSVIGKVAEETPAEAPIETPIEENELDLNFEEPVPEENNEEIPAEEETPVEDTGSEDLNLEPVEEPAEENKEEEKSEEEEEKKEESFEPHSENILAEQVENALKEEVNTDELNKKLAEHNDYINEIQNEIKAEKEAIKKAKNEFIKKMHENSLAALKDALDKAIPDEVKAEAAVEELPTAEDAAEDMTKNEALVEDKKDIIALIDETGSLLGDERAKKSEEKAKADNVKEIVHYKSDGEAVEYAKAHPDCDCTIYTWNDDFEHNIKDRPENINIKRLDLNESLNEDILVDVQLKDEEKVDTEEVKAEIEDLIAGHEEISDDSNLTTIVRDVEEIVDPTEEVEEVEEKNESLNEEDEKFPDPDKHELVDTVDGVEIYHCKNCGKYGAKINGKVVKKDSVEEIKNCINGKCDKVPEEDVKDTFIISTWESVCPKCGKDVEDPCETDREAYHCGNNLEEEEMHVMDKKEFEAAAEEAGIEKPVHEEICPECGKDVKDPCKTADDVENCKNNLEEAVNVDEFKKLAIFNDLNDAELNKIIRVFCKIQAEDGIDIAPAEVKADELQEFIDDMGGIGSFVLMGAGLPNGGLTQELIDKLAVKDPKLMKAIKQYADKYNLANSSYMDPATGEFENREVSDKDYVEAVFDVYTWDDMLKNIPEITKIYNRLSEELKEDVIAKDAPEEGDKIELKQRKVSEIHKGKEEHVPGSIVEESLKEADIPEAEVEKMLNSEEFKTPVSEAEVEDLLADKPVEESCDKKFFESIEEIEDAAIEKCITESLTTVYENVNSFKLTDCKLHENKLTISGDINFKSGIIRPTTYVFTEAKITKNRFKLTGMNETFDKDGKFILEGSLEDNNSLLIAEGLSYSYHIGDSLVENIINKD